MSKALDTLGRLRKLEAEQAKRTLAGAIAAEIAAGRALTQAQAVVAREARVVNVAAPGAFAAWLPAASAAIARCKNAETQAVAERETARSALAGCRSALKATEALLEARARQVMIEEERRATKVLDDIARPKKDVLF